MKKEFTFLGKSMEAVSLFYGVFLIMWGLIVTFTSGSQSLTSLIPSVLGLIIFVCSFLATKFPNKNKLFMHIIVIIGLLIFIGGLDFMRSLINMNSLFINFWGDISKLMMMITGIFFTFLCVKSFIFTRINR
jgi:Co/Zn/Cd efflux system component